MFKLILKVANYYSDSSDEMYRLIEYFNNSLFNIEKETVSIIHKNEFISKGTIIIDNQYEKDKSYKIRLQENKEFTISFSSVRTPEILYKPKYFLLSDYIAPSEFLKLGATKVNFLKLTDATRSIFLEFYLCDQNQLNYDNYTIKIIPTPDERIAPKLDNYIFEAQRFISTANNAQSLFRKFIREMENNFNKPYYPNSKFSNDFILINEVQNLIYGLKVSKELKIIRHHQLVSNLFALEYNFISKLSITYYLDTEDDFNKDKNEIILRIIPNIYQCRGYLLEILNEDNEVSEDYSAYTMIPFEAKEKNIRELNFQGFGKDIFGRNCEHIEITFHLDKESVYSISIKNSKLNSILKMYKS